MPLERLDLDKVRADARQASTEDLLDRATVFRDGMEREALDVIEAELRGRGVGEAERDAHAARRRDVVRGPDGLPLVCYRCDRPAVGVGHVWHRLSGEGSRSALLGILTLGLGWL